MVDTHALVMLRVWRDRHAAGEAAVCARRAVVATRQLVQP